MAELEDWLRRYRTANTRRSYRMWLLKFFEHIRATPAETLTWEAPMAEDALQSFLHYLQAKDYAPKSVSLGFMVAKQWFVTHRIRVLISSRVDVSEKTYLDYIPSREDVQALLDNAKLHHRVAIALMAFSGLRPSDVVSLEYQHLAASLEAGDEVLTIIKRHRKTRQWFPTFLGPQGTRYVRQLLDDRRRSGETIRPESKIVSWQGKTFTSDGLRKALGRIIERSVGKHPTGEPFRRFRPYGLRKYFRRALSKIGESEAEVLMGHRRGLMSLEATYSGLRDMDPQALEQLKQKYMSVLPELETEITDLALRRKVESLEENRVEREKELKEIRKDVQRLKVLLDRLDEEDD